MVFAWLPPEHNRPSGQYWFHVVSSLYDSSTSTPPELLNKFDALFFATSFWIEKSFYYHETTGQLVPGSDLAAKLRAKCFSTGSPQFEHFRICDRSAIRSRLGIKNDAKVVLLFAFETPATFWSARIFLEPSLWKRLWNVSLLPFSYPYVLSKIGKRKILSLTIKSLWERFMFLKEAFVRKSQKDAILAVKKFCVRNGAVFLIKARKKRPLHDYDMENADVVVSEDNSYFPFTTAELISASDLAFACNSTAVAESVAGCLPVINIAAPRPYYVRDHHVLLRMDRNARKHGIADENILYNPDPGGVFHFEGAVTNLEVNRFVKVLPQANLQDFAFQEGQREKFMKKFICEGTDPAEEVILRIAKKIAMDEEHSSP